MSAASPESFGDDSYLNYGFPPEFALWYDGGDVDVLSTQAITGIGFDAQKVPDAKVLDLETARRRIAAVRAEVDEARNTLNELGGRMSDQGRVVYFDDAVSKGMEPSTSVTPGDASLVGATFTGASKATKETRTSEGGPRFSHRAATENDIKTLVDLDMRAFSQVYGGYGQSEEELRIDLIKKFRGRYEKVGGEGIRIFEIDGKPSGFLLWCPTNKSPNDFVSWEETTDDGTLETTYDPNGRNAYVVSLSMVPEGSKVKGQDMLFMHGIGQLIESGRELAFFESRMPGLKKWMQTQCEKQGKDLDSLTKEDKDYLAGVYYTSTMQVDDKEVPIDRLLRLYHNVGCEFIKMVPDAYQDEPSMNYGVVAVFRNPLPKVLRNSKIASKAAGKMIRVLSKYPKIVNRVM